MTLPYALRIILESAHTASIIPLGSEPTFFALKAFGQTSMLIPVACAVFGAILGHCFNWGVGLLFSCLRTKGSFQLNDEPYEKIRSIFNRYLFFIVAFSFLPLANLLVVISGFLRTPLRKVVPLIFLGHLICYGRYLL